MKKGFIKGFAAALALTTAFGVASASQTISFNYPMPEEHGDWWGGNPINTQWVFIPDNGDLATVSSVSFVLDEASTNAAQNQTIGLGYNSANNWDQSLSFTVGDVSATIQLVEPDDFLKLFNWWLDTNGCDNSKDLAIVAEFTAYDKNGDEVEGQIYNGSMADKDLYVIIVNNRLAALNAFVANAKATEEDAAEIERLSQRVVDFASAKVGEEETEDTPFTSYDVFNNYEASILAAEEKVDAINDAITGFEDAGDALTDFMSAADPDEDEVDLVALSELKEILDDAYDAVVAAGGNDDCDAAYVILDEDYAAYEKEAREGYAKRAAEALKAAIDEADINGLIEAIETATEAIKGAGNLDSSIETALEALETISSKVEAAEAALELLDEEDELYKELSDLLDSIDEDAADKLAAARDAFNEALAAYIDELKAQLEEAKAQLEDAEEENAKLDEEIQKLEDTIDALLEVYYSVPAAIEIISGNNQSYIKGSNKDVVITAEEELEYFDGVNVNGKALTADKDYTATAGSTIITLKAAYLETLEPGAYTVEIVFKDDLGYGKALASLAVLGEAKAAPEEDKTEDKTDDKTEEKATPDDGKQDDGKKTSPQTGDNTAVAVLAVVALLSLAGVVVTKKARG